MHHRRATHIVHGVALSLEIEAIPFRVGEIRDDVVARIQGEIEGIGAIITFENVVAEITPDMIIAMATRNEIFPFAASQNVIATPPNSMSLPWLPRNR